MEDGRIVKVPRRACIEYFLDLIRVLRCDRVIVYVRNSAGYTTVIYQVRVKPHAEEGDRSTCPRVQICYLKS